MISLKFSTISFNIQRTVLFGEENLFLKATDGQVYVSGQLKFAGVGYKKEPRDGTHGDKSTDKHHSSVAETPILISFFDYRRKVDYISVGGRHSIFLCSGQVYVFGENENSQCGVPALNLITTPTKILDKRYIIIAAASRTASFFVTDKGTVFTCGTTTTGALGLYENQEAYTEIVPVQINGIPKINFIAAGLDHTIAITYREKALFGWGSTQDNRLGIQNNTSSILTPKKIGLLGGYNVQFEHVVCGANFTLALDTENNLWYTGTAVKSEKSEDSMFQIISSDKKFSYCCAGYHHALAISADRNHLYGFGLNSNGQVTPVTNKEQLKERIKWTLQPLENEVRAFKLKYVAAGVYQQYLYLESTKRTCRRRKCLCLGRRL